MSHLNNSTKLVRSGQLNDTGGRGVGFLAFFFVVGRRWCTLVCAYPHVTCRPLFVVHP